MAPNAARAWSALVDACGADAGCAAAYPDLDERLDAYVTDLVASPRAHDEVQLDGGGPRVSFLMTASRLVSYVRYYARANEYFYQLPFSIAVPPGGVASVLHVFGPDDPDTLAFRATDHYASPDRGVWQPFPQGTSSDGGHSPSAPTSPPCVETKRRSPTQRDSPMRRTHHCSVRSSAITATSRPVRSARWSRQHPTPTSRWPATYRSSSLPGSSTPCHRRLGRRPRRRSRRRNGCPLREHRNPADQRARVDRAGTPQSVPRRPRCSTRRQLRPHQSRLGVRTPARLGMWL